MTATITRLPVAASQAAPGEADETAAFTKLMWDAAVAEGERRVYARLGIPQPSSPLDRYLSAVGSAAVLAASGPSS